MQQIRMFSLWDKSSLTSSKAVKSTTRQTQLKKYSNNKGQAKNKGNKYKEEHPPWVPAHSYDYCDKNPENVGP